MNDQVEIRIDRTRNTVVFTVGEEFTFEQFQQAFETAIHHEQYDKDMHVLWDVRNVKTSSFFKGRHELEKLLQHVKSNREHYGTGFRMAIVTASDLLFGISRMYQMISEELPFERKVFRDYDKACEWLGWNRQDPTADTE